MTAPPQMAPQQIGPPILQGGTTQEDPALGINAGLRAIRIAFENIASEKSAQEAKDWAMAALNVAQAIVVLSPSVSQGGTPLEHDMAMKTLEGQAQQAVAQIHGQTQIAVEAQRGENARRQANEAAQAPTPARGKVASP
jgi:hypothetical protein